jgi:membrane-bound inhibitor of C-type lysozyme
MGVGTGLLNDLQIIFSENIGVYFTWTIEETLLPMMVTVTLDVVDLGYAPYSLAYWYNGAWHYVFPLVWAGNDVTFFVDAAKGSGRAPVAIPIAFSDGPNPEDILPVTLTNFLVSQTQGSQFATIAWTVQSETNMQGYNIYRSEGDFSSALNIKTIEALNSTELHTYSHIDEYEIVYNTTYNYWLEGVEVNGHSSILANGEVTIEEPTVEVPELSAVTKLVGNYPNPFNPTTAIKYQVKENETATLQIFNAKGQLIETATLGQTHATGSVYSFEGSKYGSGIYFYRLKTDNYSEVKKMMMLK